MVQENSTENNAQGGKIRRRGFNLTTPEKARKRLARLISMQYKGEIEPIVYKNLVYGLSKLLEYFKLENDLQIVAEIAKIKEKLGMSD